MAKVKDQRAVKVYDENGNIIAGSRPSTTNSYSSNNGSLTQLQAQMRLMNQIRLSDTLRM